MAAGALRTSTTRYLRWTSFERLRLMPMRYSELAARDSGPGARGLLGGHARRGGQDCWRLVAETKRANPKAGPLIAAEWDRLN
jgi:hypothetical protein